MHHCGLLTLVGLSLLLACAVAVQEVKETPGDPGFKNEPTGFRDLRWQASEAKIPGLRPSDEQVVGGHCYTRPEDDLWEYGQRAASIVYCFSDEGLDSVTLHYGEEPGGRRPSEERKRFRGWSDQVYKDLARVLEEQHGLPTQRYEGGSHPNRSWRGKSSISLSLHDNGIDMVIMDFERTFNRFQRSTSFFPKIASEYRRLWNELRDRARVEAAFAEWMAREGRDTVASYTIEDDGSVVIEPKGGAMFVIHAEGMPPRPPSPQDQQRQKQDALVEEHSREWQTHLQAVLALLERLVPGVRSGGPSPEQLCNFDCFKKLAGQQSKHSDFFALREQCKATCASETEEAQRQGCRQAVQEVRSYLATHAESWVRHASFLPAWSQPITLGRSRFNALLRAMRRGCAAEARVFTEILEPMFAATVGYPQPRTR